MACRPQSLYVDHRVVCTLLQTDNHTSTLQLWPLIMILPRASTVHTLKSGPGRKKVTASNTVNINHLLILLLFFSPPAQSL